MIEIFRSPNYAFISKRRYAYVISAVAILIGLISLATQGLRYDIDFTGGTLVQLRFDQKPDITRIRAALAKIQLGESVIQEFGDDREYIIRSGLRAGGTSQDVGKRVQGALATDPALGKAEVRRVEFVGPQVGRELQLQAIYAVVTGLLASMPFWFEIAHHIRLRLVFFTLIGMMALLGYVAFRFDLRGGVAAIVAVFHDVIICIGALSLFRLEFSLPVLAALLTIIGYSVNDTIVAYDRLRENRGRGGQRGKSFAQQMNDAVNQTLSRTVLTALTVFFSTAILLFLGGKVLEDFAFVLFVGVITGTYSTIYIAASLVVDWTQYVEGRGRAKKAVAKA